MSRRKAREYALQILFQLDLTEHGLNQEMLDDFWEGNREEGTVQEFANALARGTIEHIIPINDLIRKSAENWQLERMAVVDKSILRCAVFEIIYRPDIPSSVSINEAIEIAKKYSTVESASFINGILDKIAKEQAGRS